MAAIDPNRAPTRRARRHEHAMKTLAVEGGGVEGQAHESVSYHFSPNGLISTSKDHVFDGDDLRALLTGAGAESASKKLSVGGRLAVMAGRATGLTSDPRKLREASKAYMPVGKRVVMIGGGLVGVELAEFMATRGRSVTVLEESPYLAAEMAHPRRARVLEDIRHEGVALETNARVLEIGAETVRFERRVGDAAPEPGEVAADTVVVATGLVANPGPARALREAGVELVEIGDATGVSYIEGAIHDGFRAALAL